VVDDNATNRRILHKVLSQWQMKPIEVDGGHAALAALEQARDAGVPFPLVLLDVHMPGMDGFALAARIKQDATLAKATILMLSSADLAGDTARCQELGIAVYVTKPVTQSDLWNAIVKALHLPEGKLVRRPAAPSPVVAGQRRRLRVLLAEDHAVNQRLAARVLEKRDHHVVVAENGHAVLDALAQQSFDLVLMDVQMPGMDGFEATAAIRHQERTTGVHLPIIAMTAHAMKGDRERCLAAGMDEYLAKPLKADDLYATIECVLRRQAVVDLSCDSPPIDLDAALNTVEGDKDLLADLVDIFLHSYPTDMIALGKAIDSGDARELTRAAHSLKGAFGSIGAIKAQALAREIESLGRSTRLEGASSAFQQLKDELEHITTFFAEPSWRAH
jgi:CheY-like chemotaxis protein